MDLNCLNKSISAIQLQGVSFYFEYSELEDVVSVSVNGNSPETMSTQSLQEFVEIKLGSV